MKAYPSLDAAVAFVLICFPAVVLALGAATTSLFAQPPFWAVMAAYGGVSAGTVVAGMLFVRHWRRM